MKSESLYFECFKVTNFENYREKSLSIISKFGITENQLKIYQYLLKMGPNTAPKLSKLLGIPRTEVYTLTKILHEKGLITLKRKRPMSLIALPIENALTKKIEKEKNKIRELETFLLTLKHSNQSSI